MTVTVVDDGKLAQLFTVTVRVYEPDMATVAFVRVGLCWFDV